MLANVLNLITEQEQVERLAKEEAARRETFLQLQKEFGEKED